MHVAQALAVDLRQGLAAGNRFAGDGVDLGDRQLTFLRTFTLLLCQRLGKEVLPQVADAAEGLGVVPGKVADGRQITGRELKNV
ncbi:hypothetical protein D3C77_645210 [compost metagenome]